MPTCHKTNNGKATKGQGCIAALVLKIIIDSIKTSKVKHYIHGSHSWKTKFPVFSLCISIIKLQHFRLQTSLHRCHITIFSAITFFAIEFLSLNFQIPCVFPKSFNSLYGIQFSPFSPLSLWSGNPVHNKTHQHYQKIFIEIFIDIFLPVSAILDYTLQQNCASYQMLLIIFGEIIHNINGNCKWRNYDVCTIHACNEKGHVLSHSCTNTDWWTRIHGHG